MLLGYARVSTNDQAARLQLDALEAAGCERTFSERASGALAERPVLAEVLSHSRQGDTLVVWRLDRLGRSLPHLIETVQRLENAGVALKSMTEGIDTRTPTGRLIFASIRGTRAVRARADPRADDGRSRGRAGKRT